MSGFFDPRWFAIVDFGRAILVLDSLLAIGPRKVIPHPSAVIEFSNRSNIRMLSGKNKPQSLTTRYLSWVELPPNPSRCKLDAKVPCMLDCNCKHRTELQQALKT